MVLGVFIFSLGILVPLATSIIYLTRLSRFPYLSGDAYYIGNSWEINSWDILVILPLLGIVVAIVGAYWKRSQRFWIMMLSFGIIWVISFLGSYIFAVASHEISIRMGNVTINNNIIIYFIKATLDLIPGIICLILGLILKKRKVLSTNLRFQ
jgi:hypothetical protein